KGHQQLYDSSVALDLTFLRRTRRDTGRDVKSATLVFGKPLRLAFLAKAGAAFGRLGRLRAAVEFTLQLGQKLRRYRRLRQPRQRPRGGAGGVGSGHQHFIDQARQCAFAGFGRAELVDEADAQGFVGAEALAREQVAAQGPGIDRAQKEWNERGGREAK